MKQDASFTHRQPTGQKTQQRRLPCPIRPQDATDGTWGNGCIDTTQSPFAAKVSTGVLKSDNRSVQREAFLECVTSLGLFVCQSKLLVLNRQMHETACRELNQSIRWTDYSSDDEPSSVDSAAAPSEAGVSSATARNESIRSLISSGRS